MGFRAATTPSFELWTGNGTDLFCEGGLLIVLEIRDGSSLGQNATWSGMIRAPPEVRVEEAENGSAILGPIRDTVYRMGLRAFATKPGAYEFRAWVENLDSRYGFTRPGVSTVLNVTGNQTNASIANTYGPRHSIELSFVPGNASNEALVIINSSIEVAAMVWQSWPATDGPRGWNGTLQKGVNVLSFTFLWPYDDDYCRFCTRFPEYAAVYTEASVSWGFARDGVIVYHDEEGFSVAEE